MRRTKTKNIGVAVLPILSVLIGMLFVAPLAQASPDPPALDLPAADARVKATPVFTWAPVSQAAKYRIEVSTTEAFTVITWMADVFGTTATPTEELPLGSLHWRVASLDQAGVAGVSSASRSFTKDEAKPPELTAPANGAKLAYPADPAVLSWKPAPGIKQYRVELDDEPTFTGATSYTTAGTSFALAAALPSNAPRFWRVQGVSTNPAVATAWSDTSDLRSFSIAWPVATVPSLLAPADNLELDRDEIDFSWTPVPGAAEYEIQTSTAVDFTAHLTTQVTYATRYRPTNTMTQDQYYWRVRARQSNGEPTG